MGYHLNSASPEQVICLARISSSLSEGKAYQVNGGLGRLTQYS